jgi:hypothetical protein
MMTIRNAPLPDTMPSTWGATASVKRSNVMNALSVSTRFELSPAVATFCTAASVEHPVGSDAPDAAAHAATVHEDDGAQAHRGQHVDVLAHCLRSIEARHVAGHGA